jgi:hypothetical protein
MVAFYPHFVSCGEKATLKDVVGKYNVHSLNTTAPVNLHSIMPVTACASGVTSITLAVCHSTRPSVWHEN